MKSLRYGVVVMIVCSIASTVSTGAQEQAKPSLPAPARAPARVDDLAAENARLRAENDSLRARNNALNRQLEESRAAMRRLWENPGIVRPEVPWTPNPSPGAIPPGWQPRQFNGTTYYIVPLTSGAATTTERVTTGRATPERPAIKLNDTGR